MRGAPAEPLAKDELAESVQAALPEKILRKDSRRQWMLRATWSPRRHLGTIEGHLQSKKEKKKKEEGNLNKLCRLINSDTHSC